MLRRPSKLEVGRVVPPRAKREDPKMDLKMEVCLQLSLEPQLAFSGALEEGSREAS